MTALHPCPMCQQLIGTRAAPSGAVRLVRHLRKDKGKNGWSCIGTGWEVTSA